MHALRRLPPRGGAPGDSRPHFDRHLHLQRRVERVSVCVGPAAEPRPAHPEPGARAAHEPDRCLLVGPADGRGGDRGPAGPRAVRGRPTVFDQRLGRGGARGMIPARGGVRPPVPRGLSDRRLALLFVLPAVVLLLIFAVYPFIVAAADSFFRVDFLSGARTWVALGNYLQVVSDPEIRAAFVRSFVWTVVNVAVQATLGVAIALLLNAQLFGQTLARGLVLFPYVVPAIVTALVFEFMFNDVTGLVNYLLVAAHVVHAPISFLSDPKTV